MKRRCRYCHSEDVEWEEALPRKGKTVVEVHCNDCMATYTINGNTHHKPHPDLVDLINDR